MKNLIDSIDETVFKALAKNQLKILKKKNPASTFTLMSVQEDLARAVGHANMHEAKKHWEKPAVAAMDAPIQIPAIETQQKSLQMLNLASQKSDERTLSGEHVRSIMMKQSATGDGDLTSQEQKLLTAICTSETLLSLVEVKGGDRKSAVLVELENVYESAGYRVQTVGLSQRETCALDLMLNHTEGTFFGDLVRGMEDKFRKRRPYFTGPTVVLMDCMENVWPGGMEDFITQVSAQQHPVKVILFFNPDEPRFNGSSIKLLADELGFQALAVNTSSKKKVTQKRVKKPRLR